MSLVCCKGHPLRKRRQNRLSGPCTRCLACWATSDLERASHRALGLPNLATRTVSGWRSRIGDGRTQPGDGAGGKNGQLFGQFLIDRDCIICWSFTEVSEECLQGQGRRSCWRPLHGSPASPCCLDPLVLRLRRQDRGNQDFVVVRNRWIGTRRSGSAVSVRLQRFRTRP